MPPQMVQFKDLSVELYKMYFSHFQKATPFHKDSCTSRFVGEDLASEERRRAQCKQYRSWLEQQIIERRAADSDREAAKKAYEAAQLAQDKRACELDRMEQECRRRLSEANLRFNKALVGF